ncbi:AIR synthase related protein [Bacillus massilinigeriensis]|uniref:AIR synthase related protein n=1 Tax=Bacillus massilionigeriensis TaxID=1805475 RepID=UPI00096B0A94|nr:AIR synthase related protein [Bacillus massilionigeriensis]
MRNATILPFNDHESIVITCDNSGSIGMKSEDSVQVPYEVVGYFSFRVAIMECLASGATPFSVVIQNFCGDKPWSALIQGIRQGMEEVGVHLSITGSTESNFQLLQSAVSVLVLGKKKNRPDKAEVKTKELKSAVIGYPLVGSEVIQNKHEVAPLSLFKEIGEMEEVLAWPVGSKGILHEWKEMQPDKCFKKGDLTCTVDIYKSSGPSTCFLVRYPEYKEKEIKEKAGYLFHPLFHK